MIINHGSLQKLSKCWHEYEYVERRALEVLPGCSNLNILTSYLGGDTDTDDPEKNVQIEPLNQKWWRSYVLVSRTGPLGSFGERDN